MTLSQSQPSGHLNDVELRRIIESQAALIQRQDAEIERLREALRTIARVPHRGDGDSTVSARVRGTIARQALAKTGERS